MWYKHSFGFYELFWLSKKWIALSQVIRGKGEPKIDQATCSICSRSSIKSFGSSNLQFSRKSWYFMSRNRCSDVQNGYKTILERSSNHLVRFWKLRQPQDHSNLGWIDDCTYFPFSYKFKQNKQHPKWLSTLPLKRWCSRELPSHQLLSEIFKPWFR